MVESCNNLFCVETNSSPRPLDESFVGRALLSKTRLNTRSELDLTQRFCCELYPREQACKHRPLSNDVVQLVQFIIEVPLHVRQDGWQFMQDEFTRV